ncbi:tetratricopeptide repeat protein [Tranquillimonas alkanivorans]|uniref:tetratricopeptide repeat protein n=1 Tax=Tranquillimonas alkanivorans TaxID=441119 RepID=UPI001C43454F|nr:tetratricopeptide repeat protein [Tranquillimonas alkanivorans]
MPPVAEAGTTGAAALCVPTLCDAVPPEFDIWDEARRLRYGYGMTARDEVAVRWFRRAARSGDARAMHNLGLMLLRGQGVQVDRAEALRWLEAAAARGVAETALALGNLARAGGDDEAAVGYYRIAAERGDVRAMHALANMHATGRGVPLSRRLAFFLYEAAARRGHPAAARAVTPAGARLSELERDALRRAADDWRPGTSFPSAHMR